MKKLLLKSMLLLCALVVGSMNGWAALTPTYTLTATQNSGNNSYGGTYNVTIGGIPWSAPGNQNFDGYWRIGGKKAKAADPDLDVNRVITGKNTITGQIKKVTVFHNGKSHNTISVPTVTLTIASNADFSNVVDEIEVHPSISTSTAGSFDFTPTSPITYWEDCYYKFTINITSTSTSNNGLDLKSIAFYIESADVAITGISLPSTADVPVGKTRTLTATVTPDNHTGTVDWESDDTSIATVTSEGVVTGVTAGSTTIRAKSHANPTTIKAECTVTVNADIATLPFIWAGGSTSNLTALYGVTGNSLDDYADNDSNRPYLVRLNAVGDYIQIRTNAQPGIVNIGVKMLGGSTTSKIKIQESADGSEFTDVQELTISGNQNDVVNLVTTTAFKSASRYVRIYKSVHANSGNIGVGPINIALPGEPSIPVVSGTSITLTTSENMDGWRTFYPSKADQAYTTDADVYYASATGESTVTLTKIDGGVPANTPVVLHKDGATSIVLTETGTAITAPGASNKLAVSTAGQDLGKVFRLGYKSGSGKGVGFYSYTTASAPAGIIYVSSITAGARDYLEFSFEDETTGVNEVKAQKADGEYFNLAGQRVAQPTKGLYIVNGKKVIMK